MKSQRMCVSQQWRQRLKDMRLQSTCVLQQLQQQQQQHARNEHKGVGVARTLWPLASIAVPSSSCGMRGCAGSSCILKQHYMSTVGGLALVHVLLASSYSVSPSFTARWCMHLRLARGACMSKPRYVAGWVSKVSKQRSASWNVTGFCGCNILRAALV